jgi:hypothetical protein
MPSGDEIGTMRPLNRLRWGPTRVLLGPLGAQAPRGPKNCYSELWAKNFGHFLGIELAADRAHNDRRLLLPTGLGGSRTRLQRGPSCVCRSLSLFIGHPLKSLAFFIGQKCPKKSRRP